ncbi:hypothetical protein [Actinomycetospora sp. NBRC 106378]|uniref:hypothetical protein n=1 Tax=Actinomycetospora sp. NBRC 106378 TaxID=3032208 RepID=UPI00255426E7|nr:hypothetical protein [Actinomycetospora sp. NBRC 106378]
MRAVRRRVEARGGRPIEGPELWARLGWCLIKSMLWPINLGLWLWLGRPEPGTYRRPAVPTTAAASRAPAAPIVPTSPRTATQQKSAPLVDPTPSGRHARIDPMPAPASAPTFPTGPAVQVGPTAKAPFPSSNTKPGPSNSAYVPTPSAPPAPPTTPSPVLPVPRAEFGAPQLDTDYAVRVLQQAGFPATPHNVFATQERLGILFSAKARQFIEGMGTHRDWVTFVRRAGYPTADMHAWPQNVLNAIAQWDRDSVPHIQDFYERYSAILLESGGFLGGSPGTPLATAGEWNMKGIAQPDARPLPAPR